MQMMAQQSSVNTLTQYRQRVLTAIDTRINECDNIVGEQEESSGLRISLREILPGLVCRELIPFGDKIQNPWRLTGNEYSPQHEWIPTKRDRALAMWLMRNFSFGDFDSQYDSVHVVLVGDSEADLEVAKSFEMHLNPDSSFSFEAIIVNPELSIKTTQFEQFYNTKVFHSWSQAEHSIIENFTAKPGRLCVYILDLDKTMILPRGICDEQYTEINSNSLLQYIRFFAVPRKRCYYNAEFVNNCAKSFRDSYPLFRSKTTRFYGDREIEALGALSLALGIMDKHECSNFSGNELKYISQMIQRCEQQVFGVTESIKPGRYELASKHVQVELLTRHLKAQYVEYVNKSSSLNPLFRSIEEGELLKFVREENRKVLNGHLFSVLCSLSKQTNDVIFLSHTDRPARSLGLRISSRNVLYCREDRLSFFEEPLELVFEK